MGGAVGVVQGAGVPALRHGGKQGFRQSRVQGLILVLPAVIAARVSTGHVGLQNVQVVKPLRGVGHLHRQQVLGSRIRQGGDSQETRSQGRQSQCPYHAFHGDTLFSVS